MLSRRALFLSAAASVSLAASSRAAQDHPFDDVRVVTIVVPFAAGGGSDILARLLSQPLAEALKIPVVIENRPGAGGVVCGSASESNAR
jgi:tripartite-type tricarboxylate transporter receptor subunit TctC